MTWVYRLQLVLPHHSYYACEFCSAQVLQGYQSQRDVRRAAWSEGYRTLRAIVQVVYGSSMLVRGNDTLADFTLKVFPT